MLDNLMEYLQRNDEEEMRILKSWLKKSWEMNRGRRMKRCVERS